MTDSLDQLREMKGKHEAKVARLRAQLAGAETELGEVETAIRVLERLFGQGQPASSATPNENGTIILKYVGYGEEGALAPKDIQERLVADGHDLNADLVRTQLWRMAKRGMLESEGGRYWHPGPTPSVEEDDPFAAYAGETIRRFPFPPDEEDVPF